LGLNCVSKSVQFHNSRVMNKVITGATVKNYVKAIKLFCEMAANTEVSLSVLWIKYYIGEDNILGARCSELTNQLPTQIPILAGRYQDVQ